jgi:heterodisulfide reductase subunit B
MRTYLYYPGCSLKGTGRAYEDSLLAVFGALGVELKELDDWNCCGATAYMAVEELSAFALAGRNLALAEQDSGELLAPCSACYLVLNKAQRYIAEYPETRQKVEQALKVVGLTYRGTTKIRHPLDVLVNDIGLKTISGKITQPLRGLKVVPYYGCQIVRPYATFDSQTHPVALDQLLKAAGAEVVNYPLKTRCCGGSQTGTLPEVGLRLVYILMREAHKRGGDVVATVCPLCQFNLEGYQDQLGGKYGDFVSMPVLYFTQLLGLALGLSAKQLGMQRSLVPAEPILARRNLHAA